MHDTSMSKKTVYISRRARFNAAHKLCNPDWSDEKNREVFGKCANANWHGHNYELHVTVMGVCASGHGPAWHRPLSHGNAATTHATGTSRGNTGLGAEV